MITDAVVLQSPTSQLYREYAADLRTGGYALFTYEANARAFAKTWEATEHMPVEVFRNRDSRWAVRVARVDDLPAGAPLSLALPR